MFDAVVPDTVRPVKSVEAITIVDCAMFGAIAQVMGSGLGGVVSRASALTVIVTSLNISP